EVCSFAIRYAVRNVDTCITGFDREIHRIDTRLGSLVYGCSDRGASGGGGLDRRLTRALRDEDLESAGIGIVPCGLALVGEEKGLGHRKLSAGGLKQDHVLADLGITRLLAGVVDVECQACRGLSGWQHVIVCHAVPRSADEVRTLYGLVDG